MVPDDDPEDRIRQLEQPLVDTARASELGGTPPAGYTYPPPLSPPPPTYGSHGYGGSLYSGALPKSSGNRVFWIVAGFFVVGMLILIAGVVAVVMHRVSHGGIVVESTTPSATRVSTSPRTTPGGTAPPIAIPTITEPQTSAPPPAGGTVTVTGVGQNRTFACNDNIVTVSGVSNTVTITGHCTSLNVSGVKNSITVDAVDSIVASGVENQVTYHSGSPKITKSGQSVVVQQG
jgi:Protein of unknown function (DUF3060)